MAHKAAPQSNAEQNQIWTFGLIWFGQLISLVGSGLTAFGLGVWIYQQTGSVTLFALITLVGTLPGIVAAPFAGALVDRWDRRRVLIGSDAGAALITLGLALLAWNDRLEIWQICVGVGLSAVLRAFQEPASIAVTTLLIPERHYSRANGMIQFAGGTAEIIAPVLAGALLVTIGLPGVLLIDLLTFLCAVITLLLVKIPASPASDPATAEPPGSLLRDVGFGWRYIVARPSLRSMMIFFAIINFAFSMIIVLSVPMVLAFTSPATLGLIGSAGGAGMLLGAIGLSIWGGPRRQIHGVLGFGIVFGLSLMLTGLRPSAPLVGLASFLALFCLPFINGCSIAIWQRQIAPEIQGRVFATRSMIELSCMPLAYLIAGPLADRVFSPLLLPGGALVGTVGQLIGVGPGRGIALLCTLVGIIPVIAGSLGYLYRPLRMIETEVADPRPDESSIQPDLATP